MATKFKLRVYTINRGRLDEFAKMWKRVIPSLRTEFGFTVHGAWIIESANQFLWIVSYPESTSGDFERAEAEYLASPARLAQWSDPAEHIARVEVHEITAVFTTGHGPSPT